MSDSSENEHESSPVFELSLLLVFFGFLVGVGTRFLQEKINTSFSIPYTVLVLLFGIVLASIPSKALGALGKSVKLIDNLDPHLLLGGFIPALIFESAFSTNYHIIKKEFTQAILLAGPGVLLNTFLTAVFLYFIFPYDWNWSQLILFGSIVSATDPVAVVQLLRELGASKRLATLIEAESLLNDGTAFVLYMISLDFVKGKDVSASDVIVSFFRLTFLSVLMGLLIGTCSSFWLKHVFNDAKIEISITIFACYLTFHLTEVELKSSGVLSCVFLGIFLSKYKTYISPHVKESLHNVWEIFSYFSNTLVFLFSGIIIVKGIHLKKINFSDAMLLLVLYILLHITRGLTMLILWYPLSKIGYGITFEKLIVIIFSGLRGVIGLALGLITQLENFGKKEEDKFKDKVMFHICGIVFLTLIINASIMKVIVKKLGLDRLNTLDLDVLKDAIRYISDETREEMKSLKNIYIYAGADWEKVLATLPNYSDIISDNIMVKNSKLMKVKDETVKLKSVKLDKKLGTPNFNVSTMNLSRFGLEEKNEEDIKDELEDDTIRLERKNSLITDENMSPNLLNTFQTIDTNLQISDKEKRSQFIHRILSVMKSSYNKTLSEGTISQRAHMILVASIDDAMDYNKLEIHFNKIKSKFEIPNWLIKWYESNKLRRVSRYLLFSKLSIAIEIGSVFISAVVDVNEVLNNLNILDYNSICDEIIKLLDIHSNKIGDESLSIQISYPEIYKSIQTKHTTQHMVNFELGKLNELYHEGILKENEYNKMMKKLLETENHLHHKAFINIKTDNLKNTLLNLEFVSKLNNKELLKQLLSCPKKLKQKNEKIYSDSTKSDGGIIIIRGTANLVISNAVKDTYSQGSFLAWEYLLHENYIGDLIAQSPVEYLFIDDTVMKSIISDNPESEQIIYKMCGNNLLYAHFKDEFEGFNRLELSKMCHLSTFIKIKTNNFSKKLDVHALLIKGKALHNNNPFNAPTVLLPSPQVPYILDKDSILLLFYINPTNFRNKRIISISPRRGRNMDDTYKTGTTHSAIIDFHITPIKDRRISSKTNTSPKIRNYKHSKSIDMEIVYKRESVELALKPVIKQKSDGIKMESV